MGRLGDVHHRLEIHASGVWHQVDFYFRVQTCLQLIHPDWHLHREIFVKFSQLELLSYGSIAMADGSSFSIFIFYTWFLWMYIISVISFSVSCPFQLWRKDMRLMQQSRSQKRTAREKLDCVNENHVLGLVSKTTIKTLRSSGHLGSCGGGVSERSSGSHESQMQTCLCLVPCSFSCMTHEIWNARGSITNRYC